jgi:hypothetical protein
VTTITLVHRLADADRALLARFAAVAERLADVIERAVPRRRYLSLSRGLEQARTTEGAIMATAVHTANELFWDINAVDAITGASAGLSGITWTPEVAPPEAGELTTPDADGKVFVRPAQDQDGVTFAVSLRADFADGSEPQTLTASGVIEPDGRVLSLGEAVEQQRSA